jgi:hypothetical protein
LKRIQSFYTANGLPVFLDGPLSSCFSTIDNKAALEHTASTFQELLREHHIVIVNTNLSIILPDRRGLLSLNGIKEYANIEGIIIH